MVSLCFLLVLGLRLVFAQNVSSCLLTIGDRLMTKMLPEAEKVYTRLFLALSNASMVQTPQQRSTDCRLIQQFRLLGLSSLPCKKVSSQLQCRRADGSPVSNVGLVSEGCVRTHSLHNVGVNAHV